MTTDNDLKYENKNTELEKEYYLDKNINNRYFGKISVMKSDNCDQKLILIKKETNQESLAINYIKIIKEQMDLDNNNLLKIIDYSCKLTKGFCSQTYIINIYYEEFESIILEEFNQDLIKNCIKLLVSLVEINSYLQNKGIHHGDIRLENIVISNNNFKIILNNQKFEDILKKNMIYNLNLYMTPKLFNSRKKSEEFNDFKEDSFSLGLLLVSLITDFNVKTIYDISKKEFNEENFYNMLKNFKEKFGENKFIYGLILKMIDFDENERYDFIELSDKIKEYKNLKIDESLVKEGENFNVYNINYYWDNNYLRHYYFDEFSQDVEWFYFEDELNKIN